MNKISLLLLLSLFSCKKDLNLKLGDGPKAYIIAGGDKKIDIIDLEKSEKVSEITIVTNSTNFPHHIYSNPSQDLLAIANPAYDFSLGHGGLHGKQIPGGIIVIDTKTGKKKIDVSLEMSNHNVVFSPDGTELWTAKMSHSGKVLVFDAVTGVAKSEIIVEADPSEVIFSTDGKYGLVVCGESTFLYLIDVKTKEVVKQVKIDPYPSNVWPGYKNIVLVSNMTKKSVNFVDLTEMKVVDFVDFDYMPGYVCFNEKYNELWVCNSMMNMVNIYQKKDGKWLMTSKIESEGDPHMVKFYKENEKALLINQKSSTLKFINVETKEVTKEIKLSSKPNGICISN